jgi:hypothetical protein
VIGMSSRTGSNHAGQIAHDNDVGVRLTNPLLSIN